MKIAVIGTGYVGLVTGACFAELGHTVTCVDQDAQKIAALKKGLIPIYEPDLDTLVLDNSKRARLHFTQQPRQALADADVVFLAVGTPTNPVDGSADLQYIFEAARQISPMLKPQAVVVTKSTVPVGTARRIRGIIYKQRGARDVFVASNPEFLREGCAVQDFLEPDRIIVGTGSAKAEALLRRVYLPLTGRGVRLICTDTQTAELTKYAANGFLATKIAFINEMADLCEKTGANVEVLAEGMGLDPRIGRTYLKPGPGFGGSCFPKDTRALKHIATRSGAENYLIPAVIHANEQRKEAMAEKIKSLLGKNKTVAVLGLTFKANTDDMRDAASLVIVPALLKAGLHLRLYDPEGEKQAKIYLGKHRDAQWCASAEEALCAADAAVILTEWQIFTTLDWQAMARKMKRPVVVDLRNLFDPQTMAGQGIEYHSIGRAAAVPSPAAAKKVRSTTKAAKRRRTS